MERAEIREKGEKSSMAKEGKNFPILTVLLVSWT